MMYPTSRILRDAFTRTNTFVGRIDSRTTSTSVSGPNVRTQARGAYAKSASELEAKLNAALPKGYTVKVYRTVLRNFHSLTLHYTPEPTPVSKKGGTRRGRK